MAKKTIVTKKVKKIKKNIKKGKAYIKSSFNNTLITITDLDGNTLYWKSTGSSGFKGTRKGTPFASGVAATNVAEEIKNYGIEELEVYVKGIGSGRESSIRSLAASGIKITRITDITGIPHNGCRSKKPRRV